MKCIILLAFAITTVNSFTPINRRYALATTRTQIYLDNSNGNNSSSKTKFGEQATSVEERFLTDFRTADGELVDPYKLLNIKRSASKTEIKESYRRLSRKLHPDAVQQQQSNILPGRCQNLDDVREEWERVKFSYEILIDPKSRKSYDRNSKVAEVLEDPTKAVGRAVVGSTMSGLGMVLGGAFKLGEMATKKVYETAMNEKKETPPPATTPSTIEEESTKTLQTKTKESNTGPISMEAMRQMNMEARKNANSISASNDSEVLVPTSERDTASTDTKSDNVNSSTPTPVSNKDNETKKTVDLKTIASTKMNIITSNPSSSSSSSKQKKKKNKKKRRKGGGRGFG